MVFFIKQNQRMKRTVRSYKNSFSFYLSVFTLREKRVNEKKRFMIRLFRIVRENHADFILFYKIFSKIFVF